MPPSSGSIPSGFVCFRVTTQASQNPGPIPLSQCCQTMGKQVDKQADCLLIACLPPAGGDPLIHRPSGTPGAAQRPVLPVSPAVQSVLMNMPLRELPKRRRLTPPGFTSATLIKRSPKYLPYSPLVVLMIYTGGRYSYKFVPIPPNTQRNYRSYR